MGLCSCKQDKQKPIEITGSWGSARFYPVKKQVNNQEEVTLIARFKLLDKQLSSERSTYFQYELGKKIKLVIDNDTVPPSLFYYVPLINESEKQIDTKFLLGKEYQNKTRKIIIEDSSFANTANISFK